MCAGPLLFAQAPGTLDISFSPGMGTDLAVNAVAVQPDAKILVGGNFYQFNDVGRIGIARLNPNGSLDLLFQNGEAGLGGGWPSAIVLQPDGKILVGGTFQNVNNAEVRNIARLNADGTLDASFPFNPDGIPGADGGVLAVALQPADNKVIIGGYFSAVNDTPRNGLARLQPDGTLDDGFADVLSGSVQTVALQPDGKLVIGGGFTTTVGPARTGIARLNADGTVDGTFNASLNDGGYLMTIAHQSDGKLVIAGSFTTVNGTPRNNIARLNPDGSVDPDYDTSLGADNTVWSMALQPDGKVVLGGDFTTVQGVSRTRVARLHGVPQLSMCAEIPLPAGRTKAELADVNPVSVNPPGGAIWDSSQRALYPAQAGDITITWSFKTAPASMLTVATIEPLPLETYEMGQEVIPPACAGTSFDPDTAGGAYWHRHARKLYVAAPGINTILWKRTNGPSFTFPQQVVGQWPTDNALFQPHVANTPAVDLTGDGRYAYSLLLNQDGAGATVANNQFEARNAGRSMLLLAPGSNPDLTNIFFQFVQTVLWNDPTHFKDNGTAIIGEPIADPGHDPNCGSPHLFDYLDTPRPWRICVDADFYDRAARTGPIIPVNRTAGGTRADGILLIHYQMGARLRNPLNGTLVSSTVCWPYLPVRYQTVWPSNPEVMFIAGGQGSGPVMVPDPNWKIYRQPDPARYGYNPNEEHALRYPAPPPLLRLELGASNVMLAEGDLVPMNVSLVGDPAYAPTSPVTVTITSSRDADPGLSVLYPPDALAEEMTFWPTNWFAPQTVTFMATPGTTGGSHPFVVRATGGFAAERSLAATLVGTNQLALVLDSIAFEVTEAATRDVKIRLTRPPQAPVTVTTTRRATAADSPVLRVESGGILQFDAANWSTPQVVTIRADSDTNSGNDSATFNVQSTGGLTSALTFAVIQRDTTPTGDAVYALRNDLGDPFGIPVPQTSEPYVLVKYRNAPGEGRMKVYKVLTEDATHQFRSNLEAGLLLQPPYPLTTMPKCPSTVAVSGPFFRDRNQDYWARAAGIVNGAPAPATIVMRYFYRPFETAAVEGFDPPSGGAPYTGNECLPWLDRYAQTPNIPVNYTFTITWPEAVPELRIGETLAKPKFGLPDIANQCSVEVLYEQTGLGTLVKLHDPLALRTFAVNNLPGNQLPAAIRTQIDPSDQKQILMEVPLTLRKRLKFNPNTIPPRFEFGGDYDSSSVGEPLLLPNVMTRVEADLLKALSSDTSYRNAIDGLRNHTVQTVQGVSALGSQFKALSAAFAQGQGYVTLAMQNSTDCGALPVSLEIIRVTCPLYQGDIKVIYADCAFDEALTLRHSADFAGQADNYEYEWFYRRVGSLDWIKDPTQTNIDLTIRGPGLKTLEDYEYYCRYRPLTGATLCGPDWSPPTYPQLAEGWIKRVLRGVNPFRQITTDFHSGALDTTANMITQAGSRWEGDIALNCLPGNNFGLIEAYETVLNRGIDLSIGAGFVLADDTALRLAAGQLVDLYMLLGNEAYADAQDPTIGFGTDGGQFTATSVHCFQGQVNSLLDEELALLRGRSGPFSTDTSPGTRVDVRPVHNRLYWNFGPDQAGQTAYVLNYALSDRDGSGTIDAVDAQFAIPQGHGDAWGHYLSAGMSYYRLLTDANYTWLPEYEAININGANVLVNYMHERKFAKVAAARARTGAEIVNLTYRSMYVEDPAEQWLGYQDSDADRGWGVPEWASRAGQAAYFDWVVGNTLLPDNDALTPPQSRVDRTTVTALREVAASFVDIQQAADAADQGLNPLGVDKNVVPFGLDPGALTTGQTHFDQIYGRAIGAMNNAIAVFNRANEPTQLLRRQQDSLVDFQRNIDQRLNDFTNRLIEIFGYPYNEDIRGSGAYPVGYVGPDIYHHNYIDLAPLAGLDPDPGANLTVDMRELTVAPDGSLVTLTRPVAFNLKSDRLGLVKPRHFTRRLAPGELQRALGDLTQARVRLEEALVTYDNLINQIEDEAGLIKAQYDINAQEIQILNRSSERQLALSTKIKDARHEQQKLQGLGRIAVITADAAAEFLPKSVGLSVDATSVARGMIKFIGAATASAMDSTANREAQAELSAQLAKEEAQSASNLELTTLRQAQGLQAQVQQLEQLIRQEAVHRYELYNLRETISQAAGNYLSILARGNRLLEDRVRFLQESAAQVQQYRYKDMAFRVFRNDALQKYRAQFEVAARYVYLAAKAYDYETGLLRTSTKSGGAFLEDIVRKRAIGTVQNGIPLAGTTGDSGLAAPMAAMGQNYASLYSTKILSVGLWFSSYDSTANGLVQYPSAWLIPVGEDIVRAAGANDFSYRHWKVFDQRIPVPNDFLGNPPNYNLNWIPIHFSLNGEFGAVGGQRQYNSIDATTESQSSPLDTTRIQTDSGLVGRSVWNTQWMLIIPGVGLLGSNPDEGLERFIEGALVGGQRTGNGVTDIKIYFQTYSYSGF